MIPRRCPVCDRLLDQDEDLLHGRCVPVASRLEEKHRYRDVLWTAATFGVWLTAFLLYFNGVIL